MNRVYKSVFNKRLGLWQVASELSMNAGKDGSASSAPCATVVLGLFMVFGTPGQATAQTAQIPLPSCCADFATDGGAALSGGTAGGKGGIGGGGGGGSIDGAGGAGGNIWGGMGGLSGASGEDGIQATSQDDQAPKVFFGLAGGGGGSATVALRGNDAIDISNIRTNGVLNGTGRRELLVIGGAGGGAGAGAGENRGGNGSNGAAAGAIFQINLNSLAVDELFIGGDGGSAATFLSGKAGNGGAGNLEIYDYTVDAGTITIGGAAGSGDIAYAGTGGRGDFNIRGSASITATGGIVIRDTGSINISNGSSVLLNADISGAGSIIQTSGGTTILTGADTRTGNTTVTAGTLQVGNGGALGSIAGNVTVNHSGSIAFNRADALVYSGVISGSGQLRQIGNGTTTLTGANTYTGNTTVNAGTLQVGNGGTTGSIVGNASIASGAAFAFNRADALVYSGVISGSGQLRQIGAGTTTLTGTNTYTGNTTVDAGTVQVGNGGTTGSIAGNASIASGATLAFNRSDNLTYGGGISGNGKVDKLGAGVLTLSGNNSYAGGTDIGAGTLQLDHSNALGSGGVNFTGGNLRANANVVVSSPITYNSDATISATNGHTLSLNGYYQALHNLTFGSSTDNGTVLIQGEPTVMSTLATLTVAGGTLGGVNVGYFTENMSSTTINGGATLDFGNVLGIVRNLQGSGNVKSDSNRLIVREGNFAGKISGTSELVVAGSGILTLTGANDHTGLNTIDSGTLQIGNGGMTGQLGTGDITNNSVLTYNRSNSFSLANTLLGSGTFNKLGAGTLSYIGDGSRYTGTVNVDAGTLSVSDKLSGTIQVNSGGTLSGTGTTGNVVLNSGSVLATGNSIGTLTVDGDLTFKTGSRYEVEANASGHSDKVVITGTATLNGNVVALPDSGGTYKADTKYTILTATNPLIGQFNSNVTSSLTFLNASVSQDTNNVYLNLRRNDIAYADVANTRNQRNVANALQNSYSSGGNSAAMDDVLTEVNNLSADKARVAFESMSGTGLVGLQRAGANFTGNFGNQLNSRLQSAGMGRTAQSINGVQLAANDRLGDLMPALAQNTMSDVPSSSGKFSMGGSVPVDGGKHGFWLRGYGFDQDTDGDSNAASTRIKGVGISAGFDKRIQNNLVVGAAFSHGTSDVRASWAETGKSRGNAIAAYASYVTGPWTFNGNLMFAHNANSMNRNVTVGALTSTARANFDSKTISGYGEASYDLPQATWTLQPVAGLSVTHNRNDGFTETGAGALNIQAASQTITSTKTLFGARALFELNGIHVQPRAIWAHEFGDMNRGLTAQMQGAPAASFTTYGADLPRDSLITGVTVAGKTKNGFSLFADVQGEFNNKQTGLALLVGMRNSW